MARPAPALPEERFPHVARPLAAVDACLTARAVSHPEPALLPLLRAAFRGAGDAADELLSQLQADKQPKAQRVRHSARLLSPSEADQLDSEDRTRCVAVVGMKEVAITVDDPGKVVERSARAGGYGVQISFTFCGAALTDGVCPIHHLAETCTDGLFGEHCMLNPRLSLRCGHPGHLSESSSFALAIPDSALPALLAIAGAACRLVNSRDAALDIVDVHERVDEIVQEAERARLEKRPVGTPVSDRDATEAMRAGERPAAPCRALFRQPKLG